MILQVNTAPYPGVQGWTLNPADHLRVLGITWKKFEGWSDSDFVTFYGCENVPETLPSFIKRFPE